MVPRRFGLDLRDERDGLVVVARLRREQRPQTFALDGVVLRGIGASGPLGEQSPRLRRPLHLDQQGCTEVGLGMAQWHLDELERGGGVAALPLDHRRLTTVLGDAVDAGFLVEAGGTRDVTPSQG